LSVVGCQLSVDLAVGWRLQRVELQVPHPPRRVRDDTRGRDPEEAPAFMQGKQCGICMGRALALAGAEALLKRRAVPLG
jgi:hypothetical protein